MLTAAQLAEIERAMEDEHRRDREALERLKRFLKNGSNGGAKEARTAFAMASASADDDEGSSQTIIGKVEEVIFADPEKRWTVPGMVSHLANSGFKFAAKKPDATMGLVFHKLQRRGKVRIVRRGAGRTPNVYRANIQQPKEDRPDFSLESERAAS